MGLIHPLVILPEGLIEHLSPSALADVLVHESAHILRLDPLVGLLQRLAELIYWPHPLVHLLNRRLARARERDLRQSRLEPGRRLRVRPDAADPGRARADSLSPDRLAAALECPLETRGPGGRSAGPKEETDDKDESSESFGDCRPDAHHGNGLGGVRIQAAGRTRAYAAETEPGGPAPPPASPTGASSGPSRTEIADLIRAIGRDPVSAELVDRIAAIVPSALYRGSATSPG